MCVATRAQVLQTFKQLHQTCKQVFNADKKTLTEARLKINEEFKKHKHVTEPNSISELLKLSHEVINELKTSVIQAVETKPGVYTVRIRPETQTLDNIEFDENVTVEQLKQAKPPNTKCCKEK